MNVGQYPVEPFPLTLTMVFLFRIGINFFFTLNVSQCFSQRPFGLSSEFCDGHTDNTPSIIYRCDKLQEKYENTFNPKKSFLGRKLTND